MLRLLDERTGSYAEVRSARPGLLRLCAHVPGTSRITGLRVLLVADLLTRVAELGNLQALTVLVADGEWPGPGSAVQRAADALGIHPPAGHASPGDARAVLGGPADIHVVSHGTGTDHDQGGIVAFVGDARLPDSEDPEDPEDPDAHSGTTPGLLAGHEHDPLAVRFALMSFPRREPADLAPSVLAEARETVRDWRRRVAQWAEWPSKPVPAHVAERVLAAFGEFDTPSAIALLRSLADDDGVPAGARFEAFLYADRVLGLDLPSEIGKLG